ncbi:MAG: hypothetical protein GY856_53365 [bacterium]|nr:hypothetical protein [bacterium]
MFNQFHTPSTRSFPRASTLVWLLFTVAMLAPGPWCSAQPAATGEPPTAATAATAKQQLRERYGDGEAARIDRGVDQVLRFWRPDDGDAEVFASFVTSEFLPAGELLDLTFARFEYAMERIGGYMISLLRDLRRGADLEIGPLLPLDPRLAGYDPAAHGIDDLFANKIAFVALLNFPLTDLEEQIEHGAQWSRRQWAETRLTALFATRLPAEVQQRITATGAAAGAYIAAYNVYMHHLLSEDGRRLFPPGLRLISHWGLRDELKARYADPEGLEKQRMIKQVFDRIARQEIPGAVIDNPRLDWVPATNEVRVAAVEDVAAPDRSAEPVADREPDERFRYWLENFHAVRQADPYDPDNPTHIDRLFNIQRQIPEENVAELFETLLESPLFGSVGRLIEGRLGRKLEPFDIWYVGFKPRGAFDESELDAITRKRYPNADAFAADIPRILGDLGFSAERARFLAEHVAVEPSRGVGHAFGGERPDDKALLRTRIGADGMDFKGYNIAVHEFGHNVEQVFSVSAIDHTLLKGVPNTGFTEALAMVFQSRDLELLGVAGPDPEADHLNALDTYWATCEIGAVALVDMAAWRWLYEHPDADPAEFREAVLGIARDLWNRYFAETFGVRDETLLAVYSHMISRTMYIPDYPLGHIIAFQIEQHLETIETSFGTEVERIFTLGNLTPDAWMRQAVGAPLSVEPLLKATEEALDAMAK